MMTINQDKQLQQYNVLMFYCVVLAICTLRNAKVTYTDQTSC